MIDLRPAEMTCSCNSCHAKNYGEQPVNLYEIQIGSMVLVVCQSCAIELWTQISDEFMWIDR